MDANSMFVREKRIGAYSYLYLVETVRENGKTKQRIIRNLGRTEDVAARGDLDRLARSAARLSQRSMILSLLDDDEVAKLSCRRIGAALLFERLWIESGCRGVMEEIVAGRRFEFAVERAVFLTVLHRLMVSGSDRACEHWREDYRIDGVDGLQLHHLYRAMAFLGEELAETEQAGRTLAPRCIKDVIEEKLFADRRDLFSELSVAFMDTTSLYFEGGGGETLGQFGHGKDYRPHLKQMIVGVIMDQTGRPVCSEMWPGNTADRPPAPALCHRQGLRGGRPRHDQRRDHRRSRGARAGIHSGRAGARLEGSPADRAQRCEAERAAHHPARIAP